MNRINKITVESCGTDVRGAEILIFTRRLPGKDSSNEHRENRTLSGPDAEELRSLLQRFGIEI